MGYVYVPKHDYQLGPGSGPTGRYDCTAWSCSMAIDRATMGGTQITGRQVRLASNEPIPDPSSPGLNLNQVVNVAFKLHVELENRTGAPYSAMVAALREGRGVILQGDYDQIPAEYSGQLTFKGDHAVYLNHLDNTGKRVWWMDPINRKGGFYIPLTVARAYAEDFAKAVKRYPGLLFATTRPTPKLDVAQ